MKKITNKTEYKKETWIEPEEYAYPNGGLKRRAAAISDLTGKLVKVRAGIPDTFFSVPTKEGFIYIEDGTLYHHINTKG